MFRITCMHVRSGKKKKSEVQTSDAYDIEESQDKKGANMFLGDTKKVSCRGGPRCPR